MLNRFSVQQLQQLKDTVKNLTVSEFALEKDAVFKGSIGNHIRHILEFYLAFYNGYETGIVCYDERERNPVLETDLTEALVCLSALIDRLKTVPEEKKLTLKTVVNQQSYFMPTTVAREFLYLTEHTTHHAAMIRMMIHEINPDKNNASASLGFSYTTPNLCAW